MVRHCDRFEVRIHGQGFFPQSQVLAAAFAYALRPDCRVGCHHCLQRTDCHSVLRPVAGQVRVGAQEVGHHLLSGRFIPTASVCRQHRDAREISQHLRYTFHAGYIRRVSGEAFDQHDLALAAQLVSQPPGRGLCPGFLVDAHVVYAGHIQLLVHRDHDDPLGNCFFQGRVQAVHVTRVHQDRIHALRHQVLQLLDLPSRIGVRALDHQLGRDARIHVFLVYGNQLGDHLRAIFAADEGVRDTDRESSVFRFFHDFRGFRFHLGSGRRFNHRGFGFLGGTACCQYHREDDD